MEYQKITKVWKNSPQNNSETVRNKNDTKYLKKDVYLQKKEYTKIINLLDNTLTQSTKLRTKNWVEINDNSHGKYNKNSEIEFKTLMLKVKLIWL